MRIFQTFVYKLGTATDTKHVFFPLFEYLASWVINAQSLQVEQAAAKSHPTSVVSILNSSAPLPVANTKSGPVPVPAPSSATLLVHSTSSTRGNSCRLSADSHSSLTSHLSNVNARSSFALERFNSNAGERPSIHLFGSVTAEIWDPAQAANADKFVADLPQSIRPYVKSLACFPNQYVCPVSLVTNLWDVPDTEACTMCEQMMVRFHGHFPQTLSSQNCTIVSGYVCWRVSLMVHEPELFRQSLSVLPFSKLDKSFFEYFDPEKKNR